MLTRQECQLWAQNPWYNPRTGRRLRTFGLRSPRGQFLSQCARYGPDAYPTEMGLPLPPTLAVPARPLYPTIASAPVPRPLKSPLLVHQSSTTCHSKCSSFSQCKTKTTDSIPDNSSQRKISYTSPRNYG